MIAAAWRYMLWHSVQTCVQRCWRLNSMHLGDLHFFGCCGNVVRTPLWYDTGLTGKLITKQKLLHVLNYAFVSMSHFFWKVQYHLCTCPYFACPGAASWPKGVWHLKMFEVYIPTLETTIFVLIPTLEPDWCIRVPGCKNRPVFYLRPGFHKFVKFLPVRNGLLSKAPCILLVNSYT